jgi:hypothetical protein
VAMTDDEIRERARELYARFGGIANPDARLVAALLERWGASEKDRAVLIDSLIGEPDDMGVIYFGLPQRRRSGLPGMDLRSTETREVAIAAIRDHLHLSDPREG